MKLIVLYGEEKSGKTTTLKMVYEKLKQFNQVETRWFKYCDSDREHNDFRDVLVINPKDVLKITSSTHDNCDCHCHEYDIHELQGLEYVFQLFDKKIQKIAEACTIHTKDALESMVSRLEDENRDKYSLTSNSVMKCGKDFKEIEVVRTCKIRKCH